MYACLSRVQVFEKNTTPPHRERLKLSFPSPLYLCSNYLFNNGGDIVGSKMVKCEFPEIWI